MRVTSFRSLSIAGGLLLTQPACWFFSSVTNDAASRGVSAALGANNPEPQPQQPAQPVEGSASASAQVSGPSAAAVAYSPQTAPYYVSYLFMMAFNPGGLAVSNVPYQPGQYTRWSFPSARETQEASWIERARLPDDSNGNQWWKVKFHDGGNGQTTIIEGLFAPDQSRLLRLRAQFPGDTAGAELPVQSGNYYMPPQSLAPESIAGATVGTDQVTVPAGTFTARHIVFGSPSQGGQLEWWLADNVPGGTIKQTVKGSQGSDQKEHKLLELQAFGNDAQSELGSR